MEAKDDTTLDRWIIERDGKFIWLDETGDESEPLDTREQAREAIQRHVDWLNGKGA